MRATSIDMPPPQLDFGQTDGTIDVPTLNVTAVPGEDAAPEPGRDAGSVASG
jgi:hypothetical protein